MVSRRPRQDSASGKPSNPAPKRVPRKSEKAAAQTTASTISPDVRHAMIAEGAYLRAERRGFTGGDDLNDWLAAEREVDELLAAYVANPAHQ